MLNELNGVRWTSDGDYEQRLDEEQRRGIVEDLFHRYRTVSYERIANWLVENGYASSAHVVGGQGVSGLESKMSSYIFFAKDVFKTGKIEQSDYPMVEKIIQWNTLFEDRNILREKLQEKYGAEGEGRLDDAQINAICKKTFHRMGPFVREVPHGLEGGYAAR